ncbi:DUF2157 domain-containing protein [Methylobacterium sp. ID0610]|uniref:DUF2157 domain-containing protein n=1 Tax=Methylobacterium carpenticola TaxID=3344827 RepID=UPI0036B44912
MPFSYRERVLRDIRAWAARGLIDPAQALRLEAEVQGGSDLGGLQVALGVAAALLVGTAALTFVASNWAAMPPFLRLALLAGADAVVVGLACLASLRQRRSDDPTLRRIADILAALSVAVAAGALALMSQTFHRPEDLPGFALAVALVGTATALLVRSGGAAGIAAVALAVAAWPDLDPSAARSLSWPGWTAIGLLAAGQLVGWIPARSTGFLVLLLPVAAEIAVRDGQIDARRLALLAFGVIALARALPLWPSLPERVPVRLHRLAGAAAGLLLAALLARAADLTGWTDWSAETAGSATGRLLLMAAWIGLAILPHRLRGEPLPFGTLILAGVALVPLGLGGSPPSPLGEAGWAVWTVLLPILALAVAARIDGRRALYAASLAACVVLAVALMMTAGDLIGVSLHLLTAGALAALALAAIRRRSRAAPDRP